nr:hypothetical protein [Trichocoleus desertorum]
MSLTSTLVHFLYTQLAAPLSELERSHFPITVSHPCACAFGSNQGEVRRL